MPLLSSLVFLGVICSRCCEQRHCLHRDFSTSKTTALLPPPLPLLRLDHRLHHRKVISPICLSMKYRLHWTFHTSPRATRILGVTSTRLHASPIQNTLSPCPQMTLKISSPMSFVLLVMHLTPFLSQLYLVCLPPLGLWIPLVAIT